MTVSKSNSSIIINNRNFIEHNYKNNKPTRSYTSYHGYIGILLKIAIEDYRKVVIGLLLQFKQPISIRMMSILEDKRLLCSIIFC